MHQLVFIRFCSQLGLLSFADDSFPLFLQNQSNTIDSDRIRSMMEELHCTATDMDPECLSRLHKACSVIERMTSDQCRNLVSMAGKRPCLVVFVSDGCSCDIRQRIRASAEGVLVNRTGRLRI